MPLCYREVLTLLYTYAKALPVFPPNPSWQDKSYQMLRLYQQTRYGRSGHWKVREAGINPFRQKRGLRQDPQNCSASYPSYCMEIERVAPI